MCAYHFKAELANIGFRAEYAARFKAITFTARSYPIILIIATRIREWQEMVVFNGSIY
jgi:hypothetical protein